MKKDVKTVKRICIVLLILFVILLLRTLIFTLPLFNKSNINFDEFINSFPSICLLLMFIIIFNYIYIILKQLINLNEKIDNVYKKQ